MASNPVEIVIKRTNQAIDDVQLGNRIFDLNLPQLLKIYASEQPEQAHQELVHEGQVPILDMTQSDESENVFILLVGEQQRTAVIAALGNMNDILEIVDDGERRPE